MLRLLVLALVLSGCSADPPPPPPPSPPSAIPASEAPSDYIPYTDLLVGTVIRGGSGPCYTVRTDDGTEYVLHSTEEFELPYGKRVKLRTDRLHMRIDCGPGTPQRLVAVVSVN